MKICLFILPLLFLFASCNSRKQEKRESTSDIIEIVSKTKESLNKLQTLSAKQRVIYYPLISDGERKSLEVDIDFTAKRNNQDSLVGWYFKSDISDVLHDSVLICSDFCDGENYYSFDLKDSVLYKGGVEEAKRTLLSSFMKDEMRTYISFLDSRVKGDIFNDYGFGEITRLKDTVINGRYSYLIRNTFDKPIPNSEFTESYNVEEIAIDTLTHIPIYFYTRYKNYKGKELVIDQKTYRILSDLKVNEPVDDKIFEYNLEGKVFPMESVKNFEPVNFKIK